MLLGLIKESDGGDLRLPATPQTCQKFQTLGCHVQLACGFGSSLFFADQDFTAANVTLQQDQTQIYRTSDVILRLKKPSIADIEQMKAGATHISLLDPFQYPEIVEAACKAKVNLISLDMLPRITRAQPMDALSSQSNLAGYVAVILAAHQSLKVLPLMMTAAGTLDALRVLVIGAGVAGLQAIATAKRLGARVTGFDVRAAVKEQIESLGAKFLDTQLKEDAESVQTQGGYVTTLSPQALAHQQEMLTKACAQSDIIITTAQIFGKKAPIMITQAMIEKMAPGSIIIDLAVETGGNVEGVQAQGIQLIHDVKVIGGSHLASQVAASATLLYANNLYHFVASFFDKDTQTFLLPQDDEIIKGCLLTYQGNKVHPLLLQSNGTST